MDKDNQYKDLLQDIKFLYELGLKVYFEDKMKKINNDIKTSMYLDFVERYLLNKYIIYRGFINSDHPLFDKTLTFSKQRPIIEGCVGYFFSKYDVERGMQFIINEMKTMLTIIYGTKENRDIDQAYRDMLVLTGDKKQCKINLSVSDICNLDNLNYFDNSNRDDIDILEKVYEITDIKDYVFTNESIKLIQSGDIFHFVDSYTFFKKLLSEEDLNEQ